ncbi:MAG: hypothetical protein ABSA86_00920 [Oryzomonas sp.]|jgi:hypothetical protein
MTNFDIFAQIISEASGKPIEEVKLMTDAILKLVGSPGEMYEVVPNDKAQELLATLRTDLPGIRAWLITGGLITEADIATVQGRMN